MEGGEENEGWIGMIMVCFVGATMPLTVLQPCFLLFRVIDNGVLLLW